MNSLRNEERKLERERESEGGLPLQSSVAVVVKVGLRSSVARSKTVRRKEEEKVSGILTATASL